MKPIDIDSIQRERALLLRKNGMSLGKAAIETGLTKYAVRNIDRGRDDIATDNTIQDRMQNGQACLFCGGKIDQPEGAGRPRRFCSEYCRRQYWRLHRAEQKKRPEKVVTKICVYCKKPFDVYGKNERKYCCRDHYMNEKSGLIKNIFLGILGGFVGGLLFGLIGFSATGTIARLVVSVIGACICIWIGRKLFR